MAWHIRLGRDSKLGNLDPGCLHIILNFLDLADIDRPERPRQADRSADAWNLPAGGERPGQARWLAAGGRAGELAGGLLQSVVGDAAAANGRQPGGARGLAPGRHPLSPRWDSAFPISPLSIGDGRGASL